MIEYIGYLAIWLFVGWVLYPIEISLERAYGSRASGFGKAVDILLWPVMLIAITLVFIWIDGLSVSGLRKYDSKKKEQRE